MLESNVPTSRDEFTYLPPYLAPRTATERKLVEIWQNALSIDRVGINDSYEDLGGSSLVAAAIFAEILKVFDVQLEMMVLVEAPTVEELARRIDELRGATG